MKRLIAYRFAEGELEELYNKETASFSINLFQYGDNAFYMVSTPDENELELCSCTLKHIALTKYLWVVPEQHCMLLATPTGVQRIMLPETIKDDIQRTLTGDVPNARTLSKEFLMRGAVGVVSLIKSKLLPIRGMDFQERLEYVNSMY